MKNPLLLLALFMLTGHTLFAKDIYKLSYSPDTNCTLIKNSKKIPLFDKRFKMKAPNNGYTCSLIQKERYNECHIVNKKNITALVFSYGAYDFTNLITAIKVPTKNIDSFIEIECKK